MTKTKLAAKITATIATGAVLLSSVAPFAFADTVIVSGNGDSSQNTVGATTTNTNSVTQTNTSNVSNTITSVAGTGGNTASRNTGGNSEIDTGAATSTVNVSNAANTNVASVANCGCDTSTGVLISGNGVDTNSKVNVTNTNETALDQANNAQLTNTVTSKALTGDNDTDRNTGGSSTVSTGDAASNVAVNNQANVNDANVGDPSSDALDNSGDNGNTVIVTGNGDSSHNDVDLNNNNSATLGQTNVSNILNDVTAKALTGNNGASSNTGGNSTIDTGNATTTVGITNEPNFNVGSLEDCGCTAADSLLKVEGNGVDSKNKISDTENNTLDVTNANSSDLANYATPTSLTGGNTAGEDTGSVVGIDPVTVWTGNAENDATVVNAGNTNSYGPNAALSLPNVGNVQFTSDFSAFWAAWASFVGNQG